METDKGLKPSDTTGGNLKPVGMCDNVEKRTNCYKCKRTINDQAKSKLNEPEYEVLSFTDLNSFKGSGNCTQQDNNDANKPTAASTNEKIEANEEDRNYVDLTTPSATINDANYAKENNGAVVEEGIPAVLSHQQKLNAYGFTRNENTINVKDVGNNSYLKKRYGSAGIRENSSRDNQSTYSDSYNTQPFRSLDRFPQTQTIGSNPSNNLSLNDVFTTLKTKGELLYNGQEIAEFLEKLIAENKDTKAKIETSILDQINSVTKENTELVEINSKLTKNYTLLEHSKLQLFNKYSNLTITIRKIYSELENIKVPSNQVYSLWNFFSGRRKPDEDNIVNSLEKIRAYIKMLHENQNKYEAALKLNTGEYSNLQYQLSEAKKTNANLTRSFEEKQQEHKEILQKEKNKYMELKRKSEAAEAHFEKTIDANQVMLENHKSKYENRITDLKNKLHAQIHANDTISNEKSKLETKAAQEKSNFEILLEKNKDDLRRTHNVYNQLHSEWKQEIKFRNYLQSESQKLKNTIHKQENAFAEEKEKFKNSLEEIFKIVETFTKEISLEDMKRESENKIIEKAISKIVEIQNSVSKYEDQIEEFRGNTEDKTYLDIRGMLIRAIEKLDVIEIQRKKDIQIRRKEAINYIKNLQEQLEKKVYRQ